MNHHALAVDSRDSIAVALTDLQRGQKCTVRVGGGSIEVELRERIPFGHKFALRAIPMGEDVLEYGEVIGRSMIDIDAGAWIDHHNVVMESST
ncbi:MAG TPA: UxaA family hydrolase [Chloroflexota bacterium]